MSHLKIWKLMLDFATWFCIVESALSLRTHQKAKRGKKNPSTRARTRDLQVTATITACRSSKLSYRRCALDEGLWSNTILLYKIKIWIISATRSTWRRRIEIRTKENTPRLVHQDQESYLSRPTDLLGSVRLGGRWNEKVPGLLIRGSILRVTSR